ncbi:hypothetical protein [Erwinia sp. SLM-02]|uniref:hypothetical protein n=1 Tax=Erwinia sp. SLM-02 TaxID=3020057 RepID=UPI0028D3DDF9|nr:hypothetical protein [uncultured Erwinia sp.]
MHRAPPNIIFKYNIIGDVRAIINQFHCGDFLKLACYEAGAESMAKKADDRKMLYRRKGL